jgi:hypothetical protein
MPPALLWRAAIAVVTDLGEDKTLRHPTKSAMAGTEEKRQTKV